MRSIRSDSHSGATAVKIVRLTLSGETLAVGSDDLGLSMKSANGGRLMANLTEETKLENSRLSSVDRLELMLSSYDPFE